MTVAKPPPKRKIFPFKELPPELKNKIYFAALTNGAEDVVLASKTRQYRRTVHFATADDLQSPSRRYRRLYAQSDTQNVTLTKPSFVPNLLALNLEIHVEVYPILYGSNTFVMADTSALHAFCANIGIKNCAALKDVTIKGWGFSTGHKAFNHPAITILFSAVNLERLHLECAIHGWGSMKQVARQFFRDGHHWLESVGTAKGRKDVAVDVLTLGEKNLKYVYGGAYRHVRHGAEARPEEMVEEFQLELRKMLGA